MSKIKLSDHPTTPPSDLKKKKTESNVNVYVLPVENSLNRKIGRIFRGLVKD